MTMPTINPERLLETLTTLRTFGATDSGVVRPSFSAADMAARHWFTEQHTAAGLAGIPPVRLERDRYIGYLEGHIEQGPYLEAEGNKLGVVTSIVGIRGCKIVFHGQQNHAGTTPMPNRKDAGVALIDFAYKLRHAFQAIAGPKTVWTIG